MWRYLQKLRQKPERSKELFAVLFSSSVTIFIFAIWSLVVFGGKNQELASVSQDSVELEEVTPFQSMRMNLASSLEAIHRGFGGLKERLESVDLDAEYTEMRDGALENYYEQ